MDWDKFILSRLFIAVPELGGNQTFTQRLVQAGVIGKWQAGLFKALRKGYLGVGFDVMKGRPLIERIMAIAPELMSSRLMDALESMRLVSKTDARGLRVVLKAVGRTLPGQITEDTIWNRLALSFDDIFSPATINYIRALDDAQIQALATLLRNAPENFGVREEIFGYRTGTLTSGDAALIRAMLARSVARAQVLRSVISTSRQIRATLAQSRQLDDVWDVMTLVFDNAFSEKLLRNLIRSGLISPERYALVRSLQELGAGVWRKAALAHTYEGWAARSLLLSEGVLSPETIKVLLALGKITPAQAQLMYPVAQAIRGITRTVGGRWRKGQRYRIVPGEPPIRTFARMSQTTDKAILRLLAEASRDASKAAEQLSSSPSFLKQSRAAQQRLVARALQTTMRDMFANVGSLIIFGEKEAAQAALEAMTFLQKPYGVNGADLQRMLRRTAQSGVDSYISREENLFPLSRRVYKNFALYDGQVNREVQKALLRGLNSRELAAQVARFISPDTPGGSSYAAMRLARTEINNAFHFTQIRYTREMPWVEGYQWQLSGSHGRPDVCNDYAEHSEGLGKGVWAKAEVPGKPHPHCLCFITTATVDNATWYKRYRSGAYDPYISQISEKGVFVEDTYTPERTRSVVRTGATVAALNLLVVGARAAADALRR